MTPTEDLGSTRLVAGYSGTPLPKKLGIEDGARVLLVGAPSDFDDTLGALPPGARVARRAGGRHDVVVLFVTRKDDLERRFGALAKSLEPSGGLWVAWPKRVKGPAARATPPGDLTDNVVRAVGLANGLVDNKVCAVDDAWSALRFVYRLADRPAAVRPRDRAAKSGRGR